jgi:hypothetical protein
MVTRIPREPIGKVLKIVLLEIQKAGCEDYIRDILPIVEPKLNLSEDELIVHERIGQAKWKLRVHSYSSKCVKAGFITKFRGLWKLTAQGKEVITRSDEDFICELNDKYRAWMNVNSSNTEGKRSDAVMEHASCRGLIDWFWNIHAAYYKKSMRQITPHLREGGFCQCHSELIIKYSLQPNEMRAIMIIGVLIDQVINTHFQHFYADFQKTFRYPKLYAHGPYITDGITSPNWLAYTRHNYDKEVNWEVVLVVSEALLGGLYDWFKDNGLSDEMRSFQQKLKEKVGWDFEEVNKVKLLPIIERIEQE